MMKMKMTLEFSFQLIDYLSDSLYLNSKTALVAPFFLATKKYSTRLYGDSLDT